MRAASPAMGMAAAEGYCDAAVDSDGVLGLFVSPPAAVVGVPGFVRLGVVPGTCLIERVRLRMPKESARVAPSTKSFLVCARGWRRAQTHVRVIKGNQGLSRAIKGHQGPSRAIKGDRELSRAVRRDCTCRRASLAASSESRPIPATFGPPRGVAPTPLPPPNGDAPIPPGIPPGIPPIIFVATARGSWPMLGSCPEGL